MAYGDSHFEFVSSGSIATGSCFVEGFLGSYSGLSLLNQNDVVILQVNSLGNEFYVGPSATVTNFNSRRITAEASQVTFPQMRVGVASQLEWRRANGVGANLALSANNASAGWVFWRRLAFATG